MFGVIKELPRHCGLGPTSLRKGSFGHRSPIFSFLRSYGHSPIAKPPRPPDRRYLQELGAMKAWHSEDLLNSDKSINRKKSTVAIKKNGQKTGTVTTQKKIPKWFINM